MTCESAPIDALSVKTEQQKYFILPTPCSSRTLQEQSMAEHTGETAKSGE